MEQISKLIRSLRDEEQGKSQEPEQFLTQSLHDFLQQFFIQKMSRLGSYPLEASFFFPSLIFVFFLKN